MKIKLALLFLLIIFPAVAAQGKIQTRPVAKSKVAASAPKYPLSDEQKRAIQKIKGEMTLKGALIAVRVAQSAKAFDDNILSDAPSTESDEKCQKGITDALADATALRLQAVRDVVALLTTEQKQLLKAEMSKPGAQPEGLLDVVSRLFKLP